MDWNKLLTPEAIATYVAALFSLVIGIIGFFGARWITRQRPKKVILVKLQESQLLRVSPDVKDDIVITYKEKPITSLYQTSFTVRNYGDDVIDNIKLKINFKETEVIEVSIKDNIPDRESTAIKDTASDNIEVLLPFLNSQKLYKDSVQLTVIALQPISVKEIAGGGRGWTVEFFDQEKLTRALTEELLMKSENPISLIKFTIKYLPDMIKGMNL